MLVLFHYYDKNKKYKNFEFFEIKFENKHNFIIDIYASTIYRTIKLIFE